MKMRKVTSLILASALAVSMIACGGNNEPEPEATTASSESVVEASSAEVGETEETEEEVSSGLVGTRADEDYDEVSAEIYDEVLGEFLALYEEALESTDNPERYAKMAIAEAKLLETGVFTPSTTQGGAAAMSRFAPNTVSGVQYGGDNERFHNIVTTNEIVTTEDWVAMKSLFAELKGTGTYEEKAKEYLTEHGYTLKDTYTMIYSDDPQSWDPFAEWNSTLFEPLCNTFDFLMEYDCENVLQPALAESYEVSDDGLTYTFHIRKGVMWVDSQGREIAELKADDFVAGAQHTFDMGSGMEDLLTVDGAGIVGATEYYAGEIADFDQVGIKAVDDYTLEYTLEAECPFFMTMLGYTEFGPLCRSYYESLGGGFGENFNDACEYGIDPDHIAYCGPYLVTSATEKNSIVFKANPAYWNKDNINIQTLTWLYNDGSDPMKAYTDFFDGTIDGFGLTASVIETAKQDGSYDKYAHITSTNATAYITYLNLNRNAFANYNDGTALASQKTQEEVDRTTAAVNNVHFRRAMSHGLDRVTYNAQARGDDLAATNLINTYTSGDFVTIDEEITVDINGTATTFPAGTYYGQVVQAQLDADDAGILAWNPEANDGLGGASGYDGWYNTEKAAAEIELAIAELAEEGVEVSPENPIYMDYPVWSGNEVYINRANCYKQSMEAALKNNVVINIITCADVNDWYYAEYYCYSGADMNFDIGDMTGWSPDYGDPCSMLSTFLPDYAGYCTQSLGIF